MIKGLKQVSGKFIGKLLVNAIFLCLANNLYLKDEQEEEKKVIVVLKTSFID